MKQLLIRLLLCVCGSVAKRDLSERVEHHKESDVLKITPVGKLANGFSAVPVSPHFQSQSLAQLDAQATTVATANDAATKEIFKGLFPRPDSLLSSSMVTSIVSDEVLVDGQSTKLEDRSQYERSFTEALQLMRKAVPPELLIESQVGWYETQKNDVWSVTLTTPDRKRLLGLPSRTGSPSGVVNSSLIDKPNDQGYPMSCDSPLCHRGPNSKEPASCATQMFEALSIITDWMDQNSMEYVLMFGTLLGGYRQNDIIPWTGDLDIGVSQKDFQKLVDQKDIPWHFSSAHKLGIPRGCEAHHPGFPGKYQVNPSVTDPTLMPSWGSYYIDFYPFEMEKWYHPGCLEKQSDGNVIMI